jgi:hypothetical protein
MVIIVCATLSKIFDNGLDYLVEKHLRALGETVFSLYKGQGTKEEKSRMRYLFIFLFTGLTGVLLDWLQNDMPVTPEKLSELFQEFIQPFEERFDNTREPLKTSVFRGFLTLWRKLFLCNHLYINKLAIFSEEPLKT